MKKIIMIEGMMCEHCIASVTKALKKFDKEVCVDLSKAQLDTDQDDETLTNIIEDLGFEVKGIRHARS